MVAVGTVAVLVVAVMAAASVGVAHRGSGFTPASSESLGIVVLVTVGLLLATAGLILCWRQPARTSWVLLMIAGGAWFVAEWSSPGATSPWVFSLGLALSALAPAVVAHLALAFPVARPMDRAAYLLTASGYIVSLGLLGIGPALTYAPRSAGCLDCARNLWLIRDDAALGERVSRLGLACGLVWCWVVLALTGWRLLRSSPARRRLVGPVHIPALLYLVLVATGFVHGLAHGYPGSDPAFRRVWLGQALALALLALAVPVGLVIERRAYRSMTSLSLSLGSPSEPGGFAASLGLRLHDPGLTIAYPDGDRHIDAAGHAVDLRTLASGRVATRLTRDGTALATIVHRPGVLDSPYAAADLLAAAHLALENERLQAIALSQVADLRSAGRRLVTAGDEARSRLERDLHDGAQQRLIGISMGLRLLQNRTPTAAVDLDTAEAELRAAIDDLHLLARGLYPAVLRESGLRAALIALSERRLVRVHDVPAVRFSAVVEATAYLLALRASATGPVTVTASTTEAALVVTVLTDGSGGLPDLGEVRDRATALDGNVATAPTTHGSRIVLTLPMTAAEDCAGEGA